jgi:hypothetical protein
VNPSLQTHWKPPATFVHRPFWQIEGMRSEHSSMSRQSRPVE